MLTNGGVHAGTINLGDLDLWTFQADAKDTVWAQLGKLLCVLVLRRVLRVAHLLHDFAALVQATVLNKYFIR